MPGERVKVWILGVGMGPQHVTPEVATALGTVDYIIAAEKAAADGVDGLLAIRRDVVAAHPGPRGPAEIVAVTDPDRDRSPSLSGDGYRRAVGDWHRARADAYADILRARGGTAAFLVWGDPSMYDSTIRIVEQIRERGVGIDLDVLPGISAPQLLAARHRMVLHDIGQPVHITTGRRLREAVDAGQGNIVSMLNPPADRLDLTGLDDWHIWWGANLGAPGERLVAGRLGEVSPQITVARTEARAADGWVMDVFLIRRT